MPQTQNKCGKSILYVLPWTIDSAGGVNEVVRNLIRQTMLDSLFNPILLVSSWSHRQIDTDRTGPYITARTRMRSPYVAGRGIRSIIAFLLTLISNVSKWRRFLRSEHIHVVNVHFPSERFFIIALLRRLSLRRFVLVLSIHGADITHYKRSHGLKQQALQFVFRSADAIVACSRSLALETKQAVPQCADRVHTIHNGIDLDTVRAASSIKTAAPLNIPTRYIVNVATYEPKKGQDVLLAAYRKLSESRRQPKLVFAGRKTDHLSNLKQLADELGLNEQVLFIEDLEHSETLKLIAGADLFVLPSRKEPFGIVLLEAAYLETPIVASRIGGVPEVLGDSYPYLVEPDDIDELAGAISSLLDDASSHEKLIAEMRDRVSERFNWSRAYQEYMSLIGDLIESQ